MAATGKAGVEGEVCEGVRAAIRLTMHGEHGEFVLEAAMTRQTTTAQKKNEKTCNVKKKGGFGFSRGFFWLLYSNFPPQGLSVCYRTSRRRVIIDGPRDTKHE